MTSPLRTGPLSDVRVLDLTQALAGPFGTALLADLGADVVKVEAPGGDMTRQMAPFPKHYTPPGSGRTDGCDYSGYFASVNRNKRSIVLDLKSAQDRERLLDLVETFDAVVENSRAGVMDRLGLGWETLRERNPRLVYAAVRGFGDPRTGRSPYADWPAFDVVSQCMGGLVAITGPRDSKGYPAGASIGDIYPGTLMALGVVSAIHAARRTGKGQFLDVAMVDAVLSMCEAVVVNRSLGGAVMRPRGSGHPQIYPFDVFEAKDGAISIATPTDGQFRQLCEVLGQPALADDPRMKDMGSRSKHRAEIVAVLQPWARERTKKEILAELGGKVPIGPVNTAADLFDDEHVRARGMLVEVEVPGANAKQTVVAPAIKLTETPASIYRRAPKLGEHTDEVLAEAAALRDGKKP